MTVLHQALGGIFINMTVLKHQDSITRRNIYMKLIKWLYKYDSITSSTRRNIYMKLVSGFINMTVLHQALGGIFT